MGTTLRKNASLKTVAEKAIRLAQKHHAAYRKLADRYAVETSPYERGQLHNAKLAAYERYSEMKDIAEQLARLAGLEVVL